MADRSVTVRLRADISQYQRELAAAAAGTSAFSKNTSSAGKEVDKLSGRLRLAADAALTLGPALVPLGAAAVGGVAALAAQVGALGGAMGVTLLAVQGLGDGLKALDQYQLNPTAANLKKVQDEMEKLGPAGESFVRFLDSIEPNLKTLQMAAREGLLPGAQEGLDALLQRLPEVRKLIRGFATEMGDLAAEGGKALAGPGFDAFFKYLRTDGVKILDDTSRTIGNLTEAVANLFVAFGGVSSNFSGGLLKFSQGLEKASENLGSNAGFQEFIRYIQTEGPHALETLGSMANAILQIVKATAPLGGPVLTILGKVADIFAAIAQSDLGTPIYAGLAALTLYNRTLQVTTKLSKAAASVNPISAALVLGTTAVIGYKSAWDETGDSLKSFQEALKASHGDIEATTQVIEDMRAAAQQAHDDANPSGVFDSLKSQFDPKTGVAFYKSLLGMKSAEDQFSDAADKAQKELDAQGQVSGRLSDRLVALNASTRAAAEAQKEQAAATEEATQAMREQRQEALRALDAQLNYQAAIDDATKSIKDNGKNFDITTEKGRANRQALYALADGWNQQSDAAKNAKGSLEDARKGFIQTAEQMGATAKQAKALADRLFEIPPKRHTEIALDGVDNAINKAQGLKAILDSLHSKDINIALHYQTLGNKPRAPIPGGADGMTVPGPRHPYGDKMTIRVAPGEEIIGNRHGQADRFRADRAAGRIPGYAGGGTAGGVRHATGFYSETGAGIVDEAHGVAQALHMLQNALAKSEKALSKETQTRDDLQSQFDSIKSQVGSAYSTLDPFAAASSSGWGASKNPLSMFDTAVAGNTANTEAAQKALAFAAAHGLDGPLYAALAASGNLPLLQAFANLSEAEITKREQAFAAQSNARSALGGMAAQAEVGVQLAAANAELVNIKQELRALRHDTKVADANNQAAQDKNAKDVKDGVNGAAHHGHRRGR